jgi:biofilm PGA synthesis N-glycosyltransferase PgaC
MPETLRGLWKQRLRWAQGGAEIFLKNFGSLLRWRNRRMWPLLAEFLVSTLWAYAFVLSILLFLLGKVMPLPTHIHVETLFPPAFTGLVLGATCLLQFAVSIYIDRRYEKGLVGTLFWVIWYPLVFWMTNLFTSLVSFPKVMLAASPSAPLGQPGPGIQQLETP